ncbi:DUF3983 domain-containing protein [Bacillus sp. XF8]|nr:DUF3983 domain-containing protein [Bacillus sp. XF8]
MSIIHLVNFIDARCSKEVDKSQVNKAWRNVFVKAGILKKSLWIAIKKNMEEFSKGSRINGNMMKSGKKNSE